MKKIIYEIRSLATIIIIALLLKVTIVEAYIVPTGSMENTIMTGDFLIGNRFVYGLRTPDWIGVPYTDMGFSIPYYRFPEFKNPHQGDVIIFKYPRDQYHKYVKRCIAEPGDTLEVRARKVYVNSQEFPLPKHGKYIGSMLPESYQQREIFLGDQGNKDFFKAIRIPREGDVVSINTETNWEFLLPLMIMDGHKVTLQKGNLKYSFTITDPNDLYRRKGRRNVFDNYYPKGTLLNPWSITLTSNEIQYLFIDGRPVRDMKEYVIEQNYYWAMGDNRDDSLDSRFWGFVPENLILGEALFIYFSLDLDSWIPRLNRIGTVIR
ncbi:MAG: signal peptidase I [FCB group bacterium]|nr:signal peptidase I [FCB group bacterium]